MSQLINKVIFRQSELILNRPHYAYALIVLFTLLPFMTWLSVSIVALVTLRKGLHDGINAAGIGTLSLLISILLLSKASVFTILIGFLTFVPTTIGAYILRVSARWEWVAICFMGFMSLLIGIVYLYPPDILLSEYQALEVMLKRLQEDGVRLSSFLMTPSYMMAYLLGIQGLSFGLSILTPIMIGRMIQAKIFYPSGFKNEMLNFSMSPMMTLPFIIVMLGLYYKNILALSLSPLWVCYAASAGLSVLIHLFASHRVLLTTCLILTATILLPIVMLPSLCMIGVLDTVIKFRTRYASFVNSDTKKL